VQQQMREEMAAPHLYVDRPQPMTLARVPGRLVVSLFNG
jgi:hypothetical protein